jgi:hypothetical protein
MLPEAQPGLRIARWLLAFESAAGVENGAHFKSEPLLHLALK